MSVIHMTPTISNNIPPNLHHHTRVKYYSLILVIVSSLLLWSNTNFVTNFQGTDNNTVHSFYNTNTTTTTGSNSDNINYNHSTDEDNLNQNSNVVNSSELPPGLAYEPDFKFNTRPDAWDDVDALVQEWGQWNFYDPKFETRPTNDFFVGDNVRNRDLDAKDFPDNSWQRDKEYLDLFIDEGLDLVHRAKRAIFAEYGFFDYSHDKDIYENEALKKAFGITTVDFSKDEEPPRYNSRRKEGMPGSGWMSAEAMDNLSRRILHAMITNDHFTVVLGGHSSAAGHGNHFLQSYIMQLHHILEPIFYRLGIKLVTRNNAQGGLGTIQTAMGGRDIYGSEIDVIVWDSHMTEGDDMSIDFFMRQALLSTRSPFLWGGNWKLLKVLNEKVGASVGEYGTDLRAFTETRDEEQVKSLPFAIQYLNCAQENISLCNKDDNKYRSECWIERNDVKPGRRQDPFAGGRASWHPGFRYHQLQGRRMAYALLEATQLALQKWKTQTEGGDVPLNGKHWHMSKYYDDVKERLQNFDGPCEEKLTSIARLCKVSLHGRTEYTPRSSPDETSIRSIMVPTSNGYIPYDEKKVLYDAPDVIIPSLYPPTGSLDVRVIVSLGILPQKQHRNLLNGNDPGDNISIYSNTFERTLSNIEPGQGAYLYDNMSGFCDGSPQSWCDRDKDTPCLLSGHNDRRGGILFDPFSGWIVMKLADVKHGIVLVKLDLMRIKNKRTQDWTKVNNEMRSLRKKDASKVIMSENETSNIDQRNLQQLPPDMSTFLHPDCLIEYAIDGNITSLNKDAILEKKLNLQRVVAVYPLLYEEDYQGPEELEVALRVTGCTEREGGTYRLTHIYWA